MPATDGQLSDLTSRCDSAHQQDSAGDEAAPATPWRVAHCSKPSGSQGGPIDTTGEKRDAQPPPLSALNEVSTTASDEMCFEGLAGPPPTLGTEILPPNCRSDIDMALQHRSWREREQEKKLLRMETHIQTRRFDRSFATHALKILVLEAARYQRSLYDSNTGIPTDALLAARRIRPLRKTPKTTYMMWRNAELKALLDDVSLLLNTTQPVDRSENVLLQLVGLSLFASSAFPLRAL